MLVWQDMVNGGDRRRNAIKEDVRNMLPEQVKLSRDENLRVFAHDSEESQEEFAREVTMTIEQLANFPSIVVWTVFNEGWGQFEAGGITKRIRKMDPSRLVDEASGWYDQGGGDITSIHNYFLPLIVQPQPDRCVALSEFGGYSWHIPDHAWASGEFGYRKYHTSPTLTLAIEVLWKRDLFPNLINGLSAAVYTEVSDVEDETNGLLTYDREILKVNGESISRINRELLQAFENLYN